jgi:ribonuclease Z
MKSACAIVASVLLVVGPLLAQQPDQSDSTFKVLLLGTAGGPTFNAQRLGISTMVVAGRERLLFDAGRSLTTGLARLGINAADLSKVFLTHLHSDHIVSLPELLLFPWASQGRTTPLHVWGPSGTRAMMEHLQQAFAFDIHVRRDIDEKFAPEGVRAVASEIEEGVIHEANGVKVTAFLVDHGPVAPAFGYRVDYRGHSVVLSGDTRPSDNLVKIARGTDVLIHEVGRWKQDPAFNGKPDDLLPGSRQTRAQVQNIMAHHTDGVEAGRVFDRVKPKLAVFSHYNVEPAATLRLVRQTYAGAVEFGEDLMTLEIGDSVIVSRPPAPIR